VSRALSASAFEAEIARLAASLAPGERRVVALAGPPGAGKSTLAERLRSTSPLRDDGFPVLDLLPMDGFHYDDELLERLGRRVRKGTPDTFDVGGLRAMLRRLAENDEPAVAVPRFDRDLEIARAGARLIARETALVVVEGNYLLLEEAPWASLAPLFDMTALIDVAEEELSRRLTARWEGYGIDAAETHRRGSENDLPNGPRVVRGSRAPDIRIVGDAG